MSEIFSSLDCSIWRSFCSFLYGRPCSGHIKLSLWHHNLLKKLDCRKTSKKMPDITVETTPLFAIFKLAVFGLNIGLKSSFVVTQFPQKWWSNRIKNQLITYYLPMCYLLRIQQYPVNTSYNITFSRLFLGHKKCLASLPWPKVPR